VSGRDWADLARDGKSLRGAFAQGGARMEVPDPDRDDLVEMLGAAEPWKPYPVEVFPPVMRNYVLVAAEAAGCDASMVALPMLAVCAGLIGNARVIELRPGWREPAVLWAAVVARSGTGKSPALDAASVPLEVLDAEAHARYLAAHQAWEREHAIYERDKKQYRSASGGEEPPEEPIEPTPERIAVQDVTVEALATLLAANPRGLLLLREELAGWLRSFDAYRGGRGGDVAHWLSMHGARSLRVDRKATGSVYVSRAAVSIAGTIQPGSLARALGREHVEDGLLARLLLTMPPSPRKRWRPDGLPHEQAARMEDLYRALRGTVPWPDGSPRVLGLDANALREWAAYYDDHNELSEDIDDDAIAAAASKLEGGAARLALVLHLIRIAAGEDVSALEVDAASMRAGIALARWHLAEARRVYAALSPEQATGDPREHELLELKRRIQANAGTATPAQVRAWFHRYRPAGAAEAVLDSLVSRGDGLWEHAPPAPTGGRPVHRVRLHEGPGTTGTGRETPAGGVRNRGFATNTNGTANSNAPGDCSKRNGQVPG
jgi:hypothetical protein